MPIPSLVGEAGPQNGDVLFLRGSQDTRNSEKKTFAWDLAEMSFVDVAPDSRNVRSQTSQAYLALRGEILAGKHFHGVKLKVGEIAERLKVSPGAVREALSRLVPEQLVVSRDQRGFLVAPLSMEDLADLTDLRCEVEKIALRRSVERGGLDWEAGIIASAHRLAGTPRLADGDPPYLNPDWTRSHTAFHTALVAGCGSRRLLELHTQLYEQSERYRGLSVFSEGGNRNVADEHTRIMEAALAHDVEGLTELVVDHIRLTTNLILQSAESTAV